MSQTTDATRSTRDAHLGATRITGTAGDGYDCSAGVCDAND